MDRGSIIRLVYEKIKVNR
jgi:hypothetical protein